MIELINVNKKYSGIYNNKVLNDINLKIFNGDFLTIMGPSGSGKSTLINIIGFLDRKFEGLYNFNDIDTGKYNDDEFFYVRKNSVGFIFQNFQLIKNQTVYDNVGLPLLYRGYNKNYIKEKVFEVLKKVGIYNLYNKYPYEISGGQKQRVSIARAIITNPKFIVADEPTGALDSDNSKEIMEIFKKLNKNGTTIIMVTHDKQMALYSSRIVEIYDGKIKNDRYLLDEVK